MVFLGLRLLTFRPFWHLSAFVTLSLSPSLSLLVFCPSLSSVCHPPHVGIRTFFFSDVSPLDIDHYKIVHDNENRQTKNMTSRGKTS